MFLMHDYLCFISLGLLHIFMAALHSRCRHYKCCGVEQRALPIFGRAAITLGIGPHSSCGYFSQILIFVFSVLVKSLAGKSISEMHYFVSSEMQSLNSDN